MHAPFNGPTAVFGGFIILSQPLRWSIGPSVGLDWDVGRTILMRQKEKGWGAHVIDRLSADLKQAFPDMQGLSPRNLKYMRAFAAQ